MASYLPANRSLSNKDPWAPFAVRRRKRFLGVLAPKVLAAMLEAYHARGVPCFLGVEDYQHP